MYPGDDFDNRPSNRVVWFLVIVLSILLVVGTAVEISFMHDQAVTLDGVERERDALRVDNDMLRNVLLQKLDNNDRLLREVLERGKKRG
ncbi:hypothetical protein UXN85_21045 [Enterobacter hormaechei]